jgi:hypothetical protein
MQAKRVEEEMCGSRVIHRKIQSTPVSDMGVINVTYKRKIIIYTDLQLNGVRCCKAQPDFPLHNGKQKMIQ